MEKKDTFIDGLLFFMCFFPYLTIIDTPFDTQPYALFFATIMLLVRFLFNPTTRIPNIIGIYFLIFIYAIVHSLFLSDFSHSIRSLMGYISVPIFMLLSYSGFKNVNSKLLSWIATIWLFFGLIQTFITRDFGSQFVSRMSTSLDRGVTSLAVEPSYYAIMCVFILIFNSIFFSLGEYSKKRYYYIFFISSIQVILSKSAMGIMLYGVYLLSLFIFSENFKKKIKQIIIVFAISIPGMFIISQMNFSNSRIGTLLIKLDSGIVNLILKDGSISDRLSHILVSFVSLFHSKGIGFGLGQWNEHALFISQNSGKIILEISEVNFTLGRIMSGWGTVVFELGIIGVIFMLGFVYVVFKNNNKLNHKSKFLIYSVSLTVFVLMLSSVPLTYPLFGYFFGTIIKLKKDIII